MTNILLLALSDANHLHAIPVPTDYYVNPDPLEGNNSYDGESATYQGGNHGPWLTLTHAMDQQKVKDGDILWLFPGTYYENHDPGLHGSGYDCNLGTPEDFPIYWKSNVAIKAYNYNPVDPPILSTVINCNQDILKVLHTSVKVKDFLKEHYGGWGPGADAEKSLIENVHFHTDVSGNASEGGG